MSLPLPFASHPNPSIAELEAARSRSVLAALHHLGVVRYSGADARVFLQGQLSCDLAVTDRGASTYGAYCSPNGRILASFLLWREDADYLMALSRDIAGAVSTRMSKYVLRSKVVVSDGSDAIALTGVAGPRAEEALGSLAVNVPKRSGEVSRHAGVSVIGLGDGRFLLASVASGAEALRRNLSETLEPVSASAWRWLDLRNGIPWVGATTQDQWVPQMVNLELIGGVSFDKGCYTGQEIVARTQHLGTLKRRMFLANVDATAAAGDKLYSEDLGDQASGMVVNAEISPDGGYDLLAVVQRTSREASTVHLKSLNGPPLRFLALPYAIT